MNNPFGRRLRCAVLATLVAAGTFQGTSAWASFLVPLAQSGPAPAPAPGTPLPSNVSVRGRLYVVEGIVVSVLFGGAIFAVCRSSGRT